jgi:hypothetical protein
MSLAADKQQDNISQLLPLELIDKCIGSEIYIVMKVRATPRRVATPFPAHSKFAPRAFTHLLVSNRACSTFRFCFSHGPPHFRLLPVLLCE